jgi:D-amino-acid dehydrogenase
MHIDVAVVGGGMVGVSSALHCLERGLRVALVDGGDTRRRATYGNAGAISRGSIFPVASPSVMKGLFRYAANRDPGLHIDYA